MLKARDKLMPYIQYKTKRFSAESKRRINQVNDIILDYQEQGFDLTLRQLYYQLVSKDLIPNTQKSYKTLGTLVSDARLAGLIDWSMIQDRTRNLRRNPHWNSPKDIVSACADQYQIDHWVGQKFRPEVWIEKEALAGVIEGVCNELDVAYFSCRGYTSQSEMWRAAQRLKTNYDDDGQVTYIIHLGDHDPSRLDMSRDIEDRLTMFLTRDLELFENEEPDFIFDRVALNTDQIEAYSPPPNPAKITDSRAGAYIARFGQSSWELDALEPRVLIKLIRDTIEWLREDVPYEARINKQKKEKGQLKTIVQNWEGICNA
jgi:hypothetical protein